MQRILQIILMAMFAAVAVSLTGCSGSFMSDAVSSGGVGVRLKGMVHGGQPPVVGSHVYLYAAGSGGYGSASVSLLTPGLNGVSMDGGRNGYVTTDAAGGFSITGDWSCVHGNDQVYVLALGGNPGLSAGTDNNGLALMSAVGTCSGLNALTFIFVNEVSTVAAAVALQQFMTDGTHVGASSTNALGLTNAFATVGNMVGLANGLALTTTPGGNGTVPETTLNTLANILATCVNSASNTSAGCTALSAASTPSGGTAPTNTLTAALSIAQNPANNVAELYALPPSQAPFQPALTSTTPPNDWTIGITYIASGNTQLQDVQVDANGNVWTTSCASCLQRALRDSIIELSPTGSVLSGTGFTGGGSVHSPFAMAIDASGDVWVTNEPEGANPDNVTKLTSSGTLVSGFPVQGPELSGPIGIAIDSSGNAWVANSNGDTVAKIRSNGTLLSGAGYTSPGLSVPSYVAIDTSGAVWVTGFVSSSLLKLDSSGTVLSGTGAGYTGGGLNFPNGIAIDGSGDIWETNVGAVPSTVSKFGNTGTPISGSSGYVTGTTGYAPLISIDGAGTAWTATCGASCGATGPDGVARIGANGTMLTPPSGYLNANFDTPFAQAIDASGNLWVANNLGGSIVELVGVAAPVKTPTVAAVTGNLLGQKP